METLKRLADHLPDAVYMVDRDFRLTYTNRHFRHRLEYNGRAEVRCSSAAKLGLCQSSCVLESCMTLRTSTMWQESVAGQNTDGEYKVLVGASPLVDENLEVVGAFVILRDIDAEVTAYSKWRELLEEAKRAKENLERIVAERTRALETSNRALVMSRREVRDVLDNIPQAVFTTSNHLRINHEFSRQVKTIFGDVPIAGQPLASFLTPGKAQAAVRVELENWLRLVFSQPLLDWDIVSQLVPREFQYRRSTDQTLRELLLDFRPMREAPPQISRLLVIAEDVTDKRALERDLARQQQNNEENLAQIAELIQIDPSTFHSFLAEARTVLANAHQILEKLPSADDKPAQIDALFRQMHTLKGNARSFRLARIASKAHWVEETFAKLRGAPTIEEELFVETGVRLAELDAQLDKASELADRVISPSRDLARTRDSGVRHLEVPVSVTQLRKLEHMISELALRVTGPELDDLRKQLRSLSHVPLSRLFKRFPKMTHDLAAELGKRVDKMVLEGGDQTYIDAQVLHRLGNVLVHLIRNAIDHGLERPEARRAAGKREGGSITVRAQLADGELVIAVEDDGRGIDREAIVRKAIEAGLVDQARALTLSEAEVIQLIFRPGFSTATEITDISGRGVGMDAARDTVYGMGGRITIQTRPDWGTRIRIFIPESVALRGALFQDLKEEM